MQVKSGYPAGAVNIFTIPMGDQGEPSRELIETNALTAQNPDA